MSTDATWIRQLLPRGRLWSLDPASRISQFFLAIADEFQQVRQRVQDMLTEADPRAADETLPDWEDVVGLPDETVPVISGDPVARRLAITQKLVRLGGQQPAFYIALAAACGYTVAVVDNGWTFVLRSGFRSGSRCYGYAWAYAWQVNVTAPSGTALTHAQLEAVIRRASPAHTVVIFNYL